MIIADASGRVLEQWTGFQVAWTMARGYPGAFGGTSTRCTSGCRCACCSCCRSSTGAGPSRCCTSTCSCCSRSRSRSRSSTTRTSTPRCRSPIRRCSTCSRGCSRSCVAEPRAGGRPLRLLIPAPVLALGVVFLLGFRIALNVTDSNVIDVGYAGVIGAQRIVARRGSLRRLPGGQRTRRHLRPGQLRGLCPVRADLRLERHLGRSAGRARRRRSSSTCSRSRCCSCSAVACAARRSASRSPTRGSPIPSRCSRWRATPTTRSSRC